MGPKIAIVTGGERGIGLGIAQELLTRGYQVLVGGVDEGAAKANLTSLPGVQFQRCDVGREEDVRELVATALREHGRIDALVNNAGIAAPDNGPIEQLNLEIWESFLRVNLTGAMLCAKLCLPELRKTGGAIVNISSTRAHASEPNTEAYAASKAGLLGLTHALAVSTGPQVRVNAVCPGWVDVYPDWEPSPEDNAQQVTGRVGRPEEIATVVAFLLDSLQSGFMTGQHVNVDGGVRIKLGYH